MADIYDRGGALAARMLKPRRMGGKGMEILFRWETKGGYDPATQTTIPGQKHEATGWGIRTNFRADDIDGVTVLKNDFLLVVSPTAPGFDASQIPIDAAVEAPGVAGSIYRLMPVAPAGQLVLAKFHIRG